MNESTGKIHKTQEKSAVDARRRTAKMPDFRRIIAFSAPPGICMSPFDGRTC